MINVLFVCTGNAARSVMAAAILREQLGPAVDQLQVTSAGTHSIPGLPMSTRTRTALADLGVADPDHRSEQIEQSMVDQASVIVIFEPMHLKYMRKKHADAAPKVASLPRLARDLGAGPLTDLPARLQALRLQDEDFEDWEEVIDPAGGDLPVFQACAVEIRNYVTAFQTSLLG